MMFPEASMQHWERCYFMMWLREVKGQGQLLQSNTATESQSSTSHMTSTKCSCDLKIRKRHFRVLFFKIRVNMRTDVL